MDKPVEVCTFCNGDGWVYDDAGMPCICAKLITVLVPSGPTEE